MCFEPCNSAETLGIYHALQEVKKRIRSGWRGHIRVVTDSKSVAKTLESVVRNQCHSVQQLSNSIIEVSISCNVDIVWVPGHCGLNRNDFVDSLAKEALDLPLEAHVSVPIDYTDVKRRVSLQTRSRSILPSFPDGLENFITQREAEVTLSELAVGHTSCLHPLGTYMQKRRLVCTCRPGALNDAEHFVLKCPLRTRSRSLCLPSMRERQGLSVYDIIKKWPEKRLVFLARERFFHMKRSTLCRN